MAPTVIFGDIRGLELEELEPVLQKYGITRLDSAASYMAGESERRLGRAGMGERFTIDTKILGARPLDGHLTAEKIDASSEKSLEQLKVDKINVLYTHAPDRATPMDEQAKAFDDAYKKGRFSEFGLCNTDPEDVQEWLDIAKAKGYVKPTWFQGQYNLAVRTYEQNLFPILRKEGIHFGAYSPLAGGFLNGNFKPNQAPTGQRFINHSTTTMYQDWFDRSPMHTYFSKIEACAQKARISTGEISLRWLVHHSALQDGDIVILGASKVPQISQSLDQIRKGPLDPELARQVNDLWTKEMQEITADVIVYPPKSWSDVKPKS